MKAEDVVAMLDLLENEGIEVVIDGGWGVDALVGRQTRPHDDLDIAVEHRHVPRIREILGQRGYTEVPRDDATDTNFVLGDGEGHELDVHSYTFDSDGNLLYGVEYKPRDLIGTGTINGRPVRCIPPDVMVKFHTGYPLDDNDYKDVKVLCEAFDLEIPAEYEEWVTKESLS
jgi:lincosamide nucleotidyltransferase A/C/D/E